MSGTIHERPAENAASKQPQGAAAGATRSQSGTGTTTNGFQVGCQLPQIEVKPVGHNGLTGSHQGDHRSPVSDSFSTEQVKDSPAPREPKGQSSVASSK